MKKIVMIVTSFLVGLGVTLAQSSQDEKLTKNSPEICAYALGDFAHIDEDRVTCPTNVSFCVVVDEFIIEDMQTITWRRDGIPCGSDAILEYQDINETTVVSMTMTDFYGNEYSDSKTIRIQPPAGPLDAWAELVQDTVNGVAGYYTTLTWDNSEPRAYDGLALIRDGIGVGTVDYDDGYFIDPVPINPLEPPVYELEIRDACEYPSFSQIYEVVYLSCHEDLSLGGYWLVFDVGFLNRYDERIIHVLNKDGEDLLQKTLTSPKDSLLVFPDWMAQISEIQAGLSMENSIDGINSLSNWYFSPIYDWISENDKSVVEVYPNPTTGLLHVKTEEALKSVAIYDMSGRLLQSIPILEYGRNIQLDLSRLGRGIYCIMIETESDVLIRKVSIPY